jgi:hypothetical protein
MFAVADARRKAGDTDVLLLTAEACARLPEVGVYPKQVEGGCRLAGHVAEGNLEAGYRVWVSAEAGRRKVSLAAPWVQARYERHAGLEGYGLSPLLLAILILVSVVSGLLVVTWRQEAEGKVSPRPQG